MATSWAPEGTLFYFGPLRQQLDEVRIANGRTEVPAADAVQVQTKRDVSPSWKLEAVFHFYTSLTLAVNRRSIENPTWFVEPGDDWFVWDTAFDLVSAMGPSVNVIVTDDVHHRRVVQAMKEQPRHQIEQAVEWMRSHELHFYSRADVVATVSPEVSFVTSFVCSNEA